MGRLMNGVMLLAAQLPFTMLAVTLGGVSNQQIFAAYAVLAAYMLLVFSLALLGSVLFQRARQAASFTFFVLLGFFLAPVMIRALFELTEWFRPGTIKRDANFNPNAM